ncbi:MAG: zf-TFIIB domain-containing protein [Cyanobacteriota bacterium]
MPLICPVCESFLVPNYVGDIEIDVCEDSCKGIWFDEGELIKIRKLSKDPTYEEIKGEFVPKPVDIAKSETKRPCPRCNVSMCRYNWKLNSDIYVDLCHYCYGVWLDYGELKGIDDFQEPLIQYKSNIVLFNIEHEEEKVTFEDPINIVNYKTLKEEDKSKPNFVNNIMNKICNLSDYIKSS